MSQRPQVGAPTTGQRVLQAGVRVVKTYSEYNRGLVEGLGDSVKSTWGFVTRDAWQVKTWTEMGTTIVAVSLMGQPTGGIAGQANARWLDQKLGIHFAPRQVQIVMALDQTFKEMPHWKARQWGKLVGRVAGDVLTTKGAASGAKVAGQVASTAGRVAKANVGALDLGAMPAGQAAKKLATNFPSLLTDSEGFLIGPVGTMRAPVNVPVSFYASEASLRYGSFRYSTIAPNSLFRTQYFGRRMLQITEEFQPTLGAPTRSVIPKGTSVKVGIIGPQAGNGVGIPWFQFFVKKGVPFK